MCIIIEKHVHDNIFFKYVMPLCESTNMRLTDVTRLWIATFLIYAASGSVFPIFSIYMSYRGLSPYHIGLVVSMATLSSIIPIILIGHFSDIMNREMVQSVLGTCLAFLMPIYRHLNSLLPFIIIHSMYTMLSYSYMTLSSAVAMDYIRTSRGSGFGRFRTSGALGWMLGTFLCGWIVENLGFSKVFLVSSIFFLLSAFLFMLGGLRKVGLRPLKTDSYVMHITAFRNVITNRAIYPLLTSIFIASLTVPAYYTFLPLYMTEKLKASRLLSSLAFTITPVAEIPAMMYIGALSDRVDRRKVIVLCLGAYPVRYLLTVFVRDPILVVLVQLLHGLTFGGLYVVSTAYISDSVPEDMKGLALSLYTIFTNLGSFIGNYMMGSIVRSYGFVVMYFMAAFISSISIPTLVMFSSRHR
ncbi:MAG: hypothetical protein DRZ82_05080 [Thermoprotei archaeon]|nr:MAG: hypothetical protein DRZ82_05080 [Thermoprotei archaeon]